MSNGVKRIGVLVSGGGTNLQALIDAEKRGELGCGKIEMVIASKPGVYALERAANNGIEARVLARKEYGSIADYSRSIVWCSRDSLRSSMSKCTRDSLTEYSTFTLRLSRRFAEKDITDFAFTRRRLKRALRCRAQRYIS